MSNKDDLRGLAQREVLYDKRASTPTVPSWQEKAAVVCAEAEQRLRSYHMKLHAEAMESVQGPMSEEDYIKLAVSAEIDPALPVILNTHGAAHLTVCPRCGIDDFQHIKGCELFDKVTDSIDF